MRFLLVRIQDSENGIGKGREKKENNGKNNGKGFSIVIHGIQICTSYTLSPLNHLCFLIVLYK